MVKKQNRCEGNGNDTQSLREKSGYMILVILLLVGLVIQTSVAECGPSKGLVSGMTLSSEYTAPTGSIPDTPTAINQTEKAEQIRYDPNDFVNIGNELLSSGKYTEAIAAYDQALDVDEKNQGAWNGKMSALLYQDKYDDVLSLFSEAQKNVPDDFSIWVQKGRAEYYLQKWDDAAKSAETALRMKKNSIDALTLKADALAISGKSDALDVTNLVISMDPENKDIWFARGLALGEDSPEAKEAYQKDITYHSDRSCSYFHLVKSAIDENDTGTAIEVLTQMIENNPDYDNYVHSDLYTLLKYLFKKSPEIDLSSVIPLWNYYFMMSEPGKRVDFALQRWDDLKAALDPMIQNGDSEFTDTLLSSLITQVNPQTDEEMEKVTGIYIAFADKNPDERGLSLLKHANELFPDSEELWMETLILAETLEHYEDALTAYGKMLALEGKTQDEVDQYVEEQKEIYYGTAKPDTGEVSEITDPSTVQTESPDTAEFQSSQECLDAMETAFYDGDMREVIRIADRGLIQYPENGDIWGNKGSALNNLKRYDEAIEAADEAIALDRTNAHAWYVKGYALEKSGKYLDAEVYYEKALELSPDNTDFIEGMERLQKLIGE